MLASTLLRDARRSAGLTQAELARLSGTSQATLSAYEHGRKVPSASTLGRVLGAAGHRLTTTPATRRVVFPSPDLLAERGRILAEVLDLAEALPYRPSRELSYPPLSSRKRTAE